MHLKVWDDPKLLFLGQALAKVVGLGKQTIMSISVYV